jgi:hypothetical protein
MPLHLGRVLVLSACVLAAPLTAQTSKPAEKRQKPPEPVHPTDLKTVEPADVQSAIQRGCKLLLGCQESLDKKNKTKREWPYEGVVRVGGDIPIGYRIGGTAICAMALLDAAHGKLDTETKAAVDRAQAFVLEALDDPLMSPDFEKGYDTRGWGHAYGLALLLKLHGPKTGDEKDKVEARITALIDILEKTQLSTPGGWNYSRPKGVTSAPATFMTAPTLQILFEARKLGFDVDPQTIEGALKSLEDARLENGAFQYTTNPANKSGRGFEAVAGATGRSPVCESTLWLAGRGSVERIKSALDGFFAEWRWLEQRRKQTGTHVEPYMIAPYYFFFAHRFAAQAIEFLPESERAGYRARLYALLWHVREDDGGWNDRVFPRSENFGTAMTLLALNEPVAARPAGWAPAATGKVAK